MADPATKAIDLGDGTYAMSIAPMTPGGGTDTVFTNMERNHAVENQKPIRAFDNGDTTYILAVRTP